MSPTRGELLLEEAKKHPKNLDKWLDLARYAIDRYLVGLGEKAITHAEKIDAEDEQVLDLMGKMLNRTRKMEKSLEHYKRAVKLFPDNASLLTGLAAANYHIGNQEEASRYYEKALDIDPGFSWALGAYSRHLIESGEIQKAQTLIDKGLETNPGSAVIWAAKYNLLQSTQSGDSCSALSKLIEQLPDASPDDQRRAVAGLRDSERREEIIELLEKFIQSDPENINAYIALEGFHTFTDFEKRLAILTKAAQRDPTNPLIRMGRVDVLTRIGDIEGATKLLEESKEMSPEDPLLITHEPFVLSNTPGFSDSIDLQKIAIDRKKEAARKLPHIPEASVDLGLAETVFEITKLRKSEKLPDESEQKTHAARKKKPRIAKVSSVPITDSFIQFEELERGLLYFQKERWADAEVIFSNLVIAAPEVVTYWEYYGIILMVLERYEEAEPAIKRGLELDPNSILGWSFLSFVQKQLGKDADEAETTEKVQKMMRDNPDFLQQSVFFLEEAMKKKLEEMKKSIGAKE